MIDRPVHWSLLIVLGLAALASLAWGSHHALAHSDDLMRRAEEVALYRARCNPYVDPDMTYPPTAPPLFSALVGPFEGAGLRRVWLGYNALALGLVVSVLLARWGADWPLSARWFLGLATLASKPVRLTLGLGQFSLIPLGLVVAGAWLAGSRGPGRRDRAGEWLGGVLVGIALVKPTIALPFLAFFVVRGSWRVLVATVAVQGLALLRMVDQTGLGPGFLSREWWRVAREQTGAGLIDVPSVLARAWPPVVEHAGVIAVLVLAASCGLVWAMRSRSDLPLLSLCGFTAAIFTYHRPYDLVLLLPAFTMAVDQAVRGHGGGRWVVVGSFVVLLLSPSHPSVLPEWLYHLVAIGLSYGLLVWTTRAVVHGNEHPAVHVGREGPDVREFVRL